MTSVNNSNIKKDNMSVFDYFWNIEMDKDGISFSDAIKTLRLNRAKALKRLKNAGHPVKSDNDILTLRQFETLKKEYWNGVISEFEQEAAEINDEKNEIDSMLENMKYFTEHGEPIKGINNHKAESRSELKERLAEIAKCPTDYLVFDGAMCYSRRFPNVEVTIEHKCPTCGTIYKYKDWGYDDIEKIDRYVVEDRKVDQYVDEIKALGYDIFVEHMCKICYEKKYGKLENSVSVNVLSFRHLDDESYITNIVNSKDCMILAEFLKGNNAYKGSQDETIWINRKRSIIERLIGIIIEK